MTPGRSARLVLSLVLALSAGLPARADNAGVRQLFRVEPFDEPAPAFVVTGLDGTTIHSSDYRGGCLILHLFATWCAPCRTELPKLAGARPAAEAQDCKVLFVAVNEARGAAGVKQWLDEIGITDRHGFAMPEDFTRNYWSWGIPVTYWIDGEGVIRGRMLGPRPWDNPAAPRLFAVFGGKEPSGGTSAGSSK